MIQEHGATEDVCYGLAFVVAACAVVWLAWQLVADVIHEWSEKRRREGK